MNNWPQRPSDPCETLRTVRTFHPAYNQRVETQLWDLLSAADEAGIKLETVQGVHTWETFPRSRHQNALDRMRQAIRRANGEDTGCECETAYDIYIRFPDGSLKRPDLSIFCTAVPDSDQAVIEVISRGYERKDLEIGAHFYLSQGVQDVVVAKPYDGSVHHFHLGGTEVSQSPAKISLACGCEVTA